MSSPAPAPSSLSPPPYLARMAAHLRAQEPRLWEHFSSAAAAPAEEADLRLQLLKSSVRLDRATHGRLYAIAESVTRALQLDVPVTFYQAIGMDASINAAVLEGASEAHVVLHGPAIQALGDPELTAVVSHELAHLDLWRRDGGQYRVAEALLRMMAGAPRAHPAHVRSHQLFRQYCEAFADRAALAVTGDLHAVVATLVKVETGLAQVSAEAYLQQADEVLRAGAVAEGVTHPETFIRARALARWARAPEGAEEELSRHLEGPASLETLDLLRQAEWEGLTRRLIDAALAPEWMRTGATLAHARLFFPGYAPSPADPRALARALEAASDSARDYACYVLLDFAAADRSLEDAPLAQAFGVAEPLGLSARLEELARQELGLTKKRVQSIRSEAAGLRRGAAGA